MGQVKQQFITDDKQTQKALTDLVKKVQQLQAENKKLANETKKGADDFSGALTNTAQQLGGVLTGLLSIQTGVQAVSQAYSDWLAKMKGLGDEQNKIEQSITRTLGATGKLTVAPQVLAQLRRSNATDEQATAAFQGVAGAAYRLSNDQQTALAIQVANQAATGVDLGQLGAAAGEIANLNPERSAGDVLDMTVAARRMTRGDIGKLTSPELVLAMRKLTEAGLSDERGIALAIESINATGNTSSLAATIEAATAREFDVVKPSRGQMLTDADRRYNEFAQAGDLEQFQMLRQDQALAQRVLGAKPASDLALFDDQTIQANEQELRAAQRTDAAAEELRALDTFGPGRGAAQSQATAVKDDKENRALRERAASIERAKEFVRKAVVDESAWTQWWTERAFANNPRQIIADAANAGRIDRDEADVFAQREFGTRLRQNREGRYYLPGQSEGGLDPTGNKDAVNAIEQQTEVIKQSQRNPNVNNHVEQ